MNKNNLDQKLRYNDGGNVHMDFHGATNTTIDFIIKKYGSFQAAAEALYLSQPAVSQQIKSLEKLWDKKIELFYYIEYILVHIIFDQFNPIYLILIAHESFNQHIIF